MLSTKTSVNAANQDYDKLTDPSAVIPSAPVHAARLNGLLKTLANAEGAVAESIKARKILVAALEKILNTNRTALSGEEELLVQISSRRSEIDAKKKDVEDSIMRGFASNSNPGTPVGPGDGSPGLGHTPATPSAELDRPEVEALTPPGYPQPQVSEPVPELELGGSNGNGNHTIPKAPTQSPPAAGSDLLSSLATSGPYTSYGRSASAASTGSAKRRKLNDGDEFPGLGGTDAMDGLDADVAEMLRRDSGSAA